MFEKAKNFHYQSPMTVDFKSLHQIACLKEESGYLDPKTGLFVLTSFYLEQQESCCGSGCRHCPYSAIEQREAGREGVPSFPFVSTKNDK